MNPNQQQEALADQIANQIDADILLFNGEITQSTAHKFVSRCLARKRRQNVLLLLVTPGGDPDAAFKMGRILQDKYKKLSIFIPGWCKSAGTLITLAANELYMGDHGELGPLDIQLAKADEIAEMASGLTVDAALKTLETTASKMFINLLLSIRRDTGGMVLTRRASELSAEMVSKLLEPIYCQIDPLKIGENSRAMNITKAYGMRLAGTSGLLKDSKGLDYLVSAYPDHGFVIDRTEAGALFNNVFEPTDPMSALAVSLGKIALLPEQTSSDGRASIAYLSQELPPPQKKAASNAKSPTTAKTSKPAKARKRANGQSTVTP